MPIVNGVNSDEFGREDVIRMYMVVQYMGGILTQYSAVPVVSYDPGTGQVTSAVFNIQGGTQFSLGASGVDFTSPLGSNVNVSDGVYIYAEGGVELIQALAPGGIPLLGFFGTAAVARPVVTGSRALADPVTLSMLTALTALGLITNSTTA